MNYLRQTADIAFQLDPCILLYEITNQHANERTLRFVTDGIRTTDVTPSHPFSRLHIKSTTFSDVFRV